MIDSKALFLEAWDAELSKRQAESPSYEVGDYTATGREKAPYGKRTLEWWTEQGHTLVDNWVQWRKDHPAFVTWVTPDDQPAIELELRFQLPNGIPVLAFVDNIFANTKSGEICVIDKKTGRTPETPEQLGLYAVGVEIVYGKAYRPTWGFWWDASKGTHSSPLHLDRYTPDYIAAVFADAARGIAAGCFPAKPANNCANWCGVARYCAAVGGADAARVDPLLSA